MPPRRSSGGKPASCGASRAAPVRNPPKPSTPAPPPAPVQGPRGSVIGELGATVADGLTFGTGNAVAHWAVDAVMDLRVSQHGTVTSGAPAAASTMGSVEGSDACSVQSKAFLDCMNNNGNDISKCVTTQA
ncbi:hypothetical protein NE237_030221 [Protea cynaroides]|uniref:Uncharacterized protein n=1 Tax=Protea cynaroides TaxID=273540 RepID=A0A9Q0JUM5_9MAGN|nr:hypothetical protein NE237_030221 [Protea cynaroides]